MRPLMHYGLRLALPLLGICACAGAQYLQQSRLVGSNGAGPQWQGLAVAVSGDGNTAIVGGPQDNGDIGAVWIFTRSNGAWSQQGPKLVGSDWKPSLPSFTAISVAISADGNTALIGRPATDQEAGAVWVFVRDGGAWIQQGQKLIGFGADGHADQGMSVALSADGNTALIGGPCDGVSRLVCAGAVWVFTRTNGVWTQEGGKLTGSTGWAGFGASVALSWDGNTALIGAPYDSKDTGAAFVFTRNNHVWTQQGPKLVGSGSVRMAYEGQAVALSGDGNLAVIGGPYDGSTSQGGTGPGAIWVFGRTNGVWTQQGDKLNGSGATGLSDQGISVAISADGSVIVGAGLTDNNGSGALWTFTRQNGAWTQQGLKLVAAGETGPAYLSVSLGVSANADTIVAGGHGDNNNVGATWVFVTPAATSATLTSSRAASVGKLATLTATVVAPKVSLAGPPSGTVSFYDGGVLLPGSTTVLSPAGEASFTAMFSAGTHDLSAQFVPSDALHLASRGSLSMTVDRATTQTNLAATFLPAVTITATVSSDVAHPAVSGNVSFVDTVTNTVLGTRPIAGASASISVPASVVSSIAAHPIRAVYSGDVNFAPSSSNTTGVPLLINAAGGSAGVYAADEFVSLLGYLLADSTIPAQAPFATLLGGASINITDSRGAVRAALLAYVSPSQINFVIPSDVSQGAATVTLLHGGVELFTIPISIAAVAPGLVTSDGSGRGPAAGQAVQVNPDGSQTVEAIGQGIVIGSDPVFLVLYGTGIRNRSQSTVICTIGGLDLPVDYAGPQGEYAGLDQVNVRLPASLAGTGVVHTTITVDGSASNTVTLLFP